MKKIILIITAALVLAYLVHADWEDQYEVICDDGVDNDLDSFIDVADSDCNGGLQGLVTSSQVPVEDVKISIVDDSQTEIAILFTSVNGTYGWVDVPFGNYSVIATHPDYVAEVIQAEVAPHERKQVNFTGENELVLGSTCETDCTHAGNNIVYASCDGINGCSFYDSTAASACNFAQPGWIRSYSETQQVECAEGIPFDKNEAKATVSCEKKNLVKTTQIVNYQGKLVKMVIVTCG